jgi:hypothetical protein
MLWRRLPKRVAADLNDSKRLLAHGSVALGEAWCRVLTGGTHATPADLLRALSLETEQHLQAPCPSSAREQCWHTRVDQFQADADLMTRVQKQVQQLQQRGLQIVAVKTSITCTKRLNEGKEGGQNRFIADLHSMERLILHLRERANVDVHAVCGKVGGIGDYSRFFGPLSHRLHAVLQLERKHSGYRFPGLGEVHFVQDADARDPLVMMASMVGKYVRELLMTRISAHYELQDEAGEPFLVSGYNDPRTDKLIRLTRRKRADFEIPKDCFLRKGAQPEGTRIERTQRAAPRTKTVS